MRRGRPERKLTDPDVEAARWYLARADDRTIAAHEVDWLINLRDTKAELWREVESSVPYRYLESLHLWIQLLEVTRHDQSEDELIDRRWCGHCPTQRSGLDYLQPTQRRPEI